MNLYYKGLWVRATLVIKALRAFIFFEDISSDVRSPSQVNILTLENDIQNEMKYEILEY